MLCCGMFGVGSLQAQQTAVYTQDWAEFNKALNLYNNSQYQSAQILFGKLKSENSNKEIKSENSTKPGDGFAMEDRNEWN